MYTQALKSDIDVIATMRAARPSPGFTQTATALATALDSVALPRRVSSVVLPILFLIAIMAYLDKSNVNFAAIRCVFNSLASTLMCAGAAGQLGTPRAGEEEFCTLLYS
jgi:hypothetical protein